MTTALRPAPSLVRRVVVLVLGVAALSFAIQALVLARWTEPIAAKLLDTAAERARLARAVLLATPAAQRDAMATALSAPGSGLRVSRGREPPPPDDGPPPDGPPPGRPPAWLPPPDFSAALRQRVGEGIEVPGPGDGLSPGLPPLAFVLQVDGEPWLAQIVGTPPQLAVRDTLLLWLALLAAISALGLVFGVRVLAQPLARLAAQIDGQRGGLRPVTVPPGAGAELQTVVQAFNRLADEVSRSHEARQQLLAGVSHDLRTPLARLHLRVETQCDPDTADALARDLQVLGRIVDQFLAFVQGDSGVRLGVDAPLHDTVRQVVRQYTLQGQPVSLTAESVPQAQPDLAVQRLLVNLIDNALAHGRAPVRVALRAAADGHGPMLSVSDAGPGMSAVQFQQAQRPFVRLGRSTTADGHCGLGLAIVAQLAAQLGATLSVDGGADTGRPFAITVRWPLVA